MTTDQAFVPGSFRDPTSRVAISGDSVYRLLNETALSDYNAVSSTKFFQKALADGRIIPTEIAKPGEVDLQSYAGALRHKKLPLISYPYEWSFHMLKDAALLQLELLRDGLKDGVIMKDATPYNIQFEGTKPVFIDIGSFEMLKDGEPWAGYKQFCELFLYPLMLQAYKGAPFQPWLRGSIDGISPTEMRSLVSFRDTFRKGVLTHIKIHARLVRKYENSNAEESTEIRKRKIKKEMVAANINGLIRLVKKLKVKDSTTEWSTYTERAHYTDKDLESKEAFIIKTMHKKPRWNTAWDLGCNDGRFSRLVAPSTDYVLALDGDVNVIDKLYVELRSDDSVDNIAPLYSNLADPSPGIGWRNRERTTIEDRSKPDLVLCLALVHHMALTNNLPLPEIANWLADFETDVVVEFPHRDDIKVRTLLSRKREGLFDSYELGAFRKALESRMQIHDEQTTPSGTRTLFHVSPK